jgi:hypothetical protein
MTKKPSFIQTSVAALSAFRSKAMVSIFLLCATMIAVAFTLFLRVGFPVLHTQKSVWIFQIDERGLVLERDDAFLWLGNIEGVSRNPSEISDSISRGFDADLSFSPDRIDIPFWILIALFFPLPAIEFARNYVRAQRDLSIRRCKNCGYELLATTNHCPECGKVADSGAASRTAK